MCKAVEELFCATLVVCFMLVQWCIRANSAHSYIMWQTMSGKDSVKSECNKFCTLLSSQNELVSYY